MKRLKMLFLTLLLTLTIGVPASAEAPTYNGYTIVPVAINGQLIPLSVPAINFDGTSMIPLRAFSEAMGAEVLWDQKTQSVNLVAASSSAISPDVQRIIDTLEDKVAVLERAVATLQIVQDNLNRRTIDLEKTAEAQTQKLTKISTAVKATTSTSINVHQIYESARDSIVGILVKKIDGSYSTGTGVFYWSDDKSALILTNRHVIDEMSEASVILNDGIVLAGTHFVSDADLDIGVLSVEGGKLPRSVSLSKVLKAQIGDPVVIIGNPLGYKNSVAVGVLSGAGRSVGNGGYEMLQTDASVNPGNSGGPMFDKDGVMIGMVTLKMVADNVEGLGFAISMSAIEQALDVARRDYTRSYFGAILAESPAVSLGANSSAGLSVLKLDPNGALAKAGFQPGDEIIMINDQKIQALSDMRRVVDTIVASTKLSVKIRRGSLEVQYTVTTGAVKLWEYKPVLLSSPPLNDWQSAF